MFTTALLCACLGAAAPLEPGSGEELRVWLDGHKGALDVSGDMPVLRFRALVHSRLAVPVEAIEVGVLFAKEGDALSAAEPGPLYDDPSEGKRTVGAVRMWLDTKLGAGGEQAVLVESPLSPDDPEPVAWLTHILGYRLADVDVALLRELVASDVFADEAAVVATLALAGDVTSKRAVRARWGGRTELIAGLAELARAPVGDQPNLQAAIERVMAVRALGVLGGDLARATLEEVLKDPGQAALSEPLIVMSIARLRGSPLEAPMAHALPPQARRMTDVIAAALDDVAGWADPVPAVEVDETPPPTPAVDSARPLWAVALIAVAVVLAVLVVVVLRLRRRPGGSAPE